MWYAFAAWAFIAVAFAAGAVVCRRDRQPEATLVSAFVSLVAVVSAAFAVAA